MSDVLTTNWQLTGLYNTGKIFILTGSNKFPGLDNLEIPNTVSIIAVTENGKKII